MWSRTCRAWSASPRAARLLVGALLVARAGTRLSETFESITIDLPPGSFTITSGRSCRPSSPSIVCCSSKSQYESIPAISITRFSWISPQRPRVCDSPAQGVDEIARLGAKPLVRLRRTISSSLWISPYAR